MIKLEFYKGSPMKKEKFEFGIFILDCFMCIGLMIVSIVLCSILVFLLFQLVGLLLYIFDIQADIHILGGFGDYSLFLTLCHTLMFTIYFFLEKKNIIQYRIYKPSFWFVFITINSFWWYAAYWLSHNFKT